MVNLLPFLVSKHQGSRQIRPVVILVLNLHAAVLHHNSVQGATEIHTLSNNKSIRSSTINCNRKVLWQMEATFSIQLYLQGLIKTQTYLMQSSLWEALQEQVIQR